MQGRVQYCTGRAFSILTGLPEYPTAVFAVHTTVDGEDTRQAPVMPKPNLESFPDVRKEGIGGSAGVRSAPFLLPFGQGDLP